MKSSKVFSDLVRVRRRDAEWMVGLDAKVKDDDGASARFIAKGTVSER